LKYLGMSGLDTAVKQLATIGLILFLGVSSRADAGWFGLGGDSWKEEVLLHDGQKIIVKRFQSYGGRGEIGQNAPIREHTLSFTLPNTSKTIEWKSEYSEDVGRANFNLLALHVLDGTPYVVAEPNLCLSYNKWGRPNPPYVLFKYDGNAWQRIQMSELPVEFKAMNVVIYLGSQDVEAMVKKGLISAEEVNRHNSELTQYPQFKTILREAYPGAGGGCEELIKYKGYWIMPNDPIARGMVDGKTK
jgi:hypothetical protein